MTLCCGALIRPFAKTTGCVLPNWPRPFTAFIRKWTIIFGNTFTADPYDTLQCQHNNMPLLLPKIGVDWPDYLLRFGFTTLLLRTFSRGEFRLSNEALHHTSSTKLSLAIVMSTWVPKYFQGVYVKTNSMGMKKVFLNFEYFWLFLERRCLFIESNLNVT